jgi:hypothetical protein
MRPSEVIRSGRVEFAREKSMAPRRWGHAFGNAAQVARGQYQVRISNSSRRISHALI